MIKLIEECVNDDPIDCVHQWEIISTGGLLRRCKLCGAYGSYRGWGSVAEWIPIR